MDPFDTQVLTQYVESLDEPGMFFLSTFFPGIQTSEGSEEIWFDVQEHAPRLTPFVSPLMAGQVVASQGDETKSFRPAYVKDKRIIRPNAPMRRMPGEQPGGNLSPMDRLRQRIARESADQRMNLARREEVMAADFLITGTETIAGEKYPTKVVDFQRHTDLTITLSGATRWGETGVKPMDDIEVWAGLIQQHSGAVCRDIVFDPLAWAIFRVDPDVEKVLDTRRGSTSTAETGPLTRGQGADKARFVGFIGDFACWVYQDSYVDPATNTPTNLLPDHSVVMACRSGATGQEGLMGYKCYGSIQDEEAEFAADRFFSKSWLEKDPAVRYLLLQSAPLIVPYRPNASAYAKVR